MIHQEAFEIAAAELVAVSAGKVTAAVARTPNTGAYWHCHATAACMTELSYQAEEGYASLYVDTATGEALQELAHDHFAIDIQGATASVATVTITRVSTVASATVAAGTIFRTPSGARFRLDIDVELAIGVSEATGTVTSVLAGADQSVGAGKITIFVSPAPASDYTVTNVEAAAGANDLESEEDLRQRIRERDEAAPGTLAGIRRGAIESVPQVREAAAYETLDPAGRPAGDVSLVIADEDGESNSTLETAVDEALEDWRGAGIYVGTLGATVVYQDIALTIFWEPGTATQANKIAVRNAVVAIVNRLDPNSAETAADAQPGSLLTTGLIEYAARSVTGVVNATVTTPSGTVAPNKGELIRTSTGRVTVS